MSCTIALHLNCPHIYQMAHQPSCPSSSNDSSSSSSACANNTEELHLSNHNTAISEATELKYVKEPGMCKKCYSAEQKVIDDEFDGYIRSSERKMGQLRATRNNVPGLGAWQEIMERIKQEDVRWRNRIGDKERAMKGLDMRMGEKVEDNSKGLEVKEGRNGAVVGSARFRC